MTASRSVATDPSSPPARAASTPSVEALNAHLRRQARRRRWADRLAPYLFISPFILSFLIFFAVPSALSLALSFARYNGYTAVHWVGLHNYRALLSDPEFRQ